jgi:hypothetical protein
MTSSVVVATSSILNRPIDLAMTNPSVAGDAG